MLFGILVGAGTVGDAGPAVAGVGVGDGTSGAVPADPAGASFPRPVMKIGTSAGPVADVNAGGLRSRLIASKIAGSSGARGTAPAP